MKFYVAYRFTGEDPEVLKETLTHICSLLTMNGHKNYCSFFDPKMVNIGNRNVLERAFKEIDDSDSLLVFIKSEDMSEGMFIEVGYALSKKKKIILLIKEGLKTNYLNEFADKIIKFNNLEELNSIEI